MRKASINTVLSLLVAGSVLAAIVILILYVSHSSFHMASKLEEASLVQLAQSSSRTLELYLEDAKDVARALASQDAVVAGFTGDTGRIKDRFRNYIESYKNYWAIFSFDANGKIVAGFNANMNDMTGGDRSDRDYVRNVLAGKDLVLSENILSAKSGDTLIFVVGKAVRSPDGKLLGGVAVCPKWNVFTKNFIDPMRFGQRGYGFMIDGSGMMIAHALEKDLLLKDMTDSSFIRQALAQKDGILAYDWKGEHKYMGIARVASTGWLVCMTAYESEMTATAIDQRNTLIIIGILAIIAVVGSIILANRALVLRPLLAVERFTQAITAGDLRAKLSGVFRFELADLAANLRAMVAELKNKLGFAEGVLAGIPAPCAIAGPDSRILWINRQAIELLDITATQESAKGQMTGELFYGDPNRETLTQKTIRERRAFSDDVTFSTRTGKSLHLHVDTTPFYDMDGELLGCLVFWNDLTAIIAQKNSIEEQNAVISSVAAEATMVADRMAQGAEELSAQIDQASQSAQEQSNRIGETATAVEEMNATILEVAQNAGRTAENAETARNKAREGAELVTSVIKAVETMREEADALTKNMQGLDQQAQGIGAIMDVISDIADQTNLLALNAAIEAARAGDAGRGFAVVADEVRKLAEKTMNATKEVGQSIAGIQQGAAATVTGMERAVQRVADATDLAERSGGALEQIVTLVETAGDQVRSIAAAAEQQSATAEEINRAVGDVNNLSAEAADAMTQSAQAVAQLSELATTLNTLIGHLQTKEGGPKALA